MGAFNDILKALAEEEGKEIKVTVLRAEDSTESESGDEKNVELKNSTLAARIAKAKIAVFASEEIKDLSKDEIKDVLGSVGLMFMNDGKSLDLDEDFGMFCIKKSEKVARKVLAELERDEKAGD